MLQCDRFSFILATEAGLATRKVECLRDACIVVVNGAITWTKHSRADIWATDTIARDVGTFPPRLGVWGPLESAPAFRSKGIPFTPLPVNAVQGPGGTPREADAFFKALGFAIDFLGAKKIRVHGARDWNRPDVRWKRWALANIRRLVGPAGVEIERPW